MNATLQSVGQDVKQAWRIARAHPAFTLVALVTLAVGIGANAAMFSVVDTVLLRALPFREAERLVVLDEYRQGHGSRKVSWMDFGDWRQANEVNPIFDGLAAYRLTHVSLTGDGEATLLQAAEVSAPFFDLLGSQPVLGRTFGERDDTPGSPRVAIVSHDMWLSRLNGAGDVIGQSIDLNGTPYSVAGVLPPSFDFFEASVDVYLPVGLHGNDSEWTRRGNHPDLLVLGRLGRDRFAVFSASRA
jgi:putative ABC transport system permease protein